MSSYRIVKNQILFSIVMLIPCASLFAQTDSSLLVLKNGSRMSAVIVKVEPWGCILNDQRTALFSVLKQLTTNDTSIVNQVLAVVESVDVRTEGTDKILDFSHAKIWQNTGQSKSPVIVRTLWLNMWGDYAVTYGMQVDFMPGIADFLMCYVGYSGGSTISGGVSTNGIHFGGGYLWNMENQSVVVAVNYFYRTESPVNKQSTETKAPFLSAEMQFDLSHEMNFVATVGGYLFFSKVGYETRHAIGGLKLGIGLNLSKIGFNQ